MSVIVVTGSGGLVGSAAVRKFTRSGCTVVGIDNDLRGELFGGAGSVRRNIDNLLRQWSDRYTHHFVDIRDLIGVGTVFKRYGDSVDLVIHAAGQPSHDWSAYNVIDDFGINATGTVHLLEATRTYSPGAVFIYMSTNKVYGDLPNYLPFVEGETRWLVDPRHRFSDGIDESMRLDGSKHSPFGVSKLAGDLMTQEYGRYFGMQTVCFRCGCITGPCHRGVELHGFLAYLLKCCATGTPYTVYGHKCKQVRDNIHVVDLVEAMWEFYMNPSPGAVYNMGGGLKSNCSMLEAISMCEKITGHCLDYAYEDRTREGDHRWWISNTGAFKLDFPAWGIAYDVFDILTEMYDSHREEWL